MRLSLPQYLFPSFIFPNRDDADEHRRPGHRMKSSDDVTRESSFYYLSCKGCHTPLTKTAIISKGFSGRYGRGYLCHDVVNVDLGKVQERSLITGLHTVRDLTCKVCKTSIGWKYCTTREPSQRYKMGKFLLEATHAVKIAHWPASNDSDPASQKTDYYRSNWDTGSIDLATLPDEDSRPSTPMMGKQVQGNMFYDDIEDLMLGWADGPPRARP